MPTDSHNPIMNPQKSQPAFTLTELLVVIGIIGLLATILIPVLTATREAGNATKCVSNLRQISLTALNYSNDHQGELPASRYSWSAAAYWSRWLMEKEYLPSSLDDPPNAVLLCPTYREIMSERSGDDDIRSTYAANRILCYSYGTSWGSKPRTVSMVPYPAKVAFYTEVDSFTFAFDSADGLNLSSLLQGESKPLRDIAVTENVWSKSLRWGKWRFVHYQPEQFGGDDVGELYDLENDPEETCNHYYDPDHAPTVTQCRRLLLEWIIRTLRCTTAQEIIKNEDRPNYTKGMHFSYPQDDDGRLPSRLQPRHRHYNEMYL